MIIAACVLLSLLAISAASSLPPTPPPVRDPFFSKQWYLDTKDGGISATSAWWWGRGEGVTIAVIDDGIPIDHPDLQANVDLSLSYDYYDFDSDPSPHFVDRNGAGIAGVIAASPNDLCIRGVAFNAKIAGIRYIPKSLLWNDIDADVAIIVSHGADRVDVYSHTWIPSEGLGRHDVADSLTLASLSRSVESGRGGRGSVHIAPALHGTGVRGVEMDHFLTSRYVVLVADSIAQGKEAKERKDKARGGTGGGASVLVCAAASSAKRSVVSLDKTSCDLATPSPYIPAALTSGTVALLLSVAPSLSWMDVQFILAKSAKSDLPSNWTRNGAGLSHSYEYGFGRVDADAAVELARIWKSPDCRDFPKMEEFKDSRTSYLMSGEAPVAYTFHCKMEGEASHVEVDVTLDHPEGTGVTIWLVSPSNTESILLSPLPARPPRFSFHISSSSLSVDVAAAPTEVDSLSNSSHTFRGLDLGDDDEIDLDPSGCAWLANRTRGGREERERERKGEGIMLDLWGPCSCESRATAAARMSYQIILFAAPDDEIDKYMDLFRPPSSSSSSLPIRSFIVPHTLAKLVRDHSKDDVAYTLSLRSSLSLPIPLRLSPHRFTTVRSFGEETRGQWSVFLKDTRDAQKTLRNESKIEVENERSAAIGLVTSVTLRIHRLC